VLGSFWTDSTRRSGTWLRPGSIRAGTYTIEQRPLKGIMRKVR
jgi:hypothetical protein